MTQNAKDNVRQRLLDTGRRLVTEKGAEYLTARKLSEASGCSIGTIYNLSLIHISEPTRPY